MTILDDPKIQAEIDRHKREIAEMDRHLKNIDCLTFQQAINAIEQRFDEIKSQETALDAIATLEGLKTMINWLEPDEPTKQKIAEMAAA